MNSNFVAAERAQVEQFFKDSALSDRPVVCGTLIYLQKNIYLFIIKFLGHLDMLQCDSVMLLVSFTCASHYLTV